MEPEVTAKRPSRKSSKPPLTLEAAKEKILAKLQTVGAKGATSLYTKTQAKDPATFEAALAELADPQRPEVFVDRRGAKPKYFLWSARPVVPTAASVGEKLLAFLRTEHPRIHSEKTLKKPAVKKKLGLAKDEATLLAAALQALRDAGSVTALEYPDTKPATLYLAASTGAPEPAAAAFSPEPVRQAYQTLTRQSGFPAVSISKLAAAAMADLDALKTYLREEYRAGRVVLSLGDWSIASDEDRRGVIELHGQRYLQVRWL